MTAAMATNDTVKHSLIVPFPKDKEASDIAEGLVDEVTVNERIAVVVMLSVFSVVGVVGNATAFYIFSGRRTTSTSIIFILALAGTDFLTCLVTIPYTIVFELLKYNLVYDMACKTYLFLITSTVPFSAYIMVGIALDRYFCICHPFWYVFTLKRAKGVIICMGIPAVIFGVITALSHGTYVYQLEIDPNSTSQTAEKLHGTLIQTGKAEVDQFLATNNVTSNSSKLNIVHYGQCVNNTFIFSREFLEVYEIVHALNFVFAYISVAVLYVLIYKSIFTRRVNKAKRKKCNLYPTTGKKTKEKCKEETQMSPMNCANLTGVKELNNQTRGDGKSARKIILTARNDPSASSKSDHQKTYCTVLRDSDVSNDDKTRYLSKNPDPSNNGVNKQSNFTTSTKTSPTEYFDKDNYSSVYVGPHTLKEENIAYNGPQISGEEYSVYVGPQNNAFENNIYVAPQPREDERSVCIGLSMYKDENAVHIGPQACTDENTVYVGPHVCTDETIVYVGPQACTDENIVYIGSQTSKEDKSIHMGPYSSKEEREVDIGLQRSKEAKRTFISPETYKKENSVNNGSQICTEENSVYIGPQESKETSAYVGQKECVKNVPLYLDVKGKYDKENKEEANGSTICPRSNNEYKKTFGNDVKVYQDRYVNNYGDISSAVYSGCTSAPEEKPLLPQRQQIPNASNYSLSIGINLNSSSRSISQTQETCLAGEAKDKTGRLSDQTNTTTHDANKKRPCTTRDRHLIPNIKTAFMLFIVTLVFIIAFLPALLMANDLIQLNLIVFYSYFLYNVVNPFIYAFMNQTFRDDLKKLMNICQR